jgi:hypothetical protein
LALRKSRSQQRFKKTEVNTPMVMTSSPFKSLREDIDWLWTEWWLGQPDELTEGHLRRGSATLQLLLVDGLLQKAWRHYGFERQPKLVGPDIVAIAASKGLRLDLAAGCIAGGGRQKGVDVSFIGGFRVDNPSTGVPADAEVGFAVCVTSIARIASEAPVSAPWDALIERSWDLSEYLESPGAVRKGEMIKRREIIEYFRNYIGGAHHDLLKGAKHANNKRYELVADLADHVRADVRDGLYFELLSIGQSVARSDDVRALVERMQRDS